MAIIYAEDRFPAHMNSQGEDYRDAHGIPDTAPFDEYERAAGMPAPIKQESAGTGEILCMVALICVAYVACTITEAPGRALRWAGSTSAPFAALAVLLVGGIATAAAIALAF